MPRRPTGKRVPREDGSFVVVSKAANRAGSVFHVPERRTTLPDGSVRVKRAHWRATYRDPVSGQKRVVYAPTRDEITRLKARCGSVRESVDRGGEPLEKMNQTRPSRAAARARSRTYSSLLGKVATAATTSGRRR